MCVYICPLLCWQGQCRFTEHGGASPVDVREEVVCPFFVHRLRSDRNYTERSQERMRDSIFFFFTSSGQNSTATARRRWHHQTGDGPEVYLCRAEAVSVFKGLVPGFRCRHSGFCTRCSTSRERERERGTERAESDEKSPKFDIQSWEKKKNPKNEWNACMWFTAVRLVFFFLIHKTISLYRNK